MAKSRLTLSMEQLQQADRARAAIRKAEKGLQSFRRSYQGLREMVALSKDPKAKELQSLYERSDHLIAEFRTLHNVANRAWNSFMSGGTHEHPSTQRRAVGTDRAKKGPRSKDPDPTSSGHHGPDGPKQKL